MTSMLLRPGDLRAVDRVADREGEHAAEQRGDHPTSIVFQIERMRQRVVEQPLEMDQRVCLHVEQALESRMNRNLRNAATISASVGSTTTTTR